MKEGIVLAVIREITDCNAPELDMFAHLTEQQLRSRREPEKGIFIAESLKVIQVALQAGYTPLAFLMERKRIAGQAGALLASWKDVPVYTGDRDILAQLTGYPLTRGVLCAMRRPVLPAPEKLLRQAGRVAVLDGITDATNVGAIFRSAAALDMDAVIVTHSCCDPLCRRAVRVSMGTVFQIPWSRMEGDMPVFHELGFKTAAMALCEQTIPIEQLQPADEDKLAVFFGTEGDGLPRDVIEACDYVVKIPMAHHVDSLNVAAASAVVFWQLRRKKNGLQKKNK
jgi:tRNA G18 (ribose-2'-O)-methylase SpoU